MAQADRLAVPGGVLNVGEQIELTGSGNYQWYTGSGLSCGEIIVRGELVENTSPQSRIEGNETEFLGCSTPFAFEEPKIDNFIFEAGEGSFTMNYNMTPSCPMSGTFAFESEYGSNRLFSGEPNYAYGCYAQEWNGVEFRMQLSDSTPVEVVE